METYDVIVIGLGGMGSATVSHLAQRGVRTLGLEQFDIAHDRGSSHGETRILRKAYFEHPDYIPLLHHAYELWDQLATDQQTTLVRRIGLLLAGPGNGMVVPNVKRAAKEHDLAIEEIPRGQAHKRFPGIRFSDEMDVLFEEDAGYLLVEACVRAHVQAAASFGATLHAHEHVLRWEAYGSDVVVETDRSSYEASRLVVCAGAWSAALLADLAIPLEVRRKVALWYPTTSPHYQEKNGFPVFGVETESNFFYGFPEGAAGLNNGLKVGNHTGGSVVAEAGSVDRSLCESDERDVRGFLKTHMPGVTLEASHHSVCMYTMTPDEHFIIDRHPNHENVWLAAGFSGHGFKFAPVVGSVLADLVIEGCTKEPIDLFRLNRLRNV